MFPEAQTPTAILYLQPSEVDIEKDQLLLKKSYYLRAGHQWDVAIYGIERVTLSHINQSWTPGSIG